MENASERLASAFHGILAQYIRGRVMRCLPRGAGLVRNSAPARSLRIDDRGGDRRRAAAAPVKVLLPLPLRGALDYRPPEGGAAPLPGQFVRVSLGSRRVVGVVWDDAIGRARSRPSG